MSTFSDSYMFKTLAVSCPKPFVLHVEFNRLVKKNLHYTGVTTPKCVTSVGAQLRGLGPGQHSSEETWQRRRDVVDTVSYLIGLEIEPQSSRFNSVCLTTELYQTVAKNKSCIFRELLRNNRSR